MRSTVFLSGLVLSVNLLVLWSSLLESNQNCQCRKDGANKVSKMFMCTQTIFECRRQIRRKPLCIIIIIIIINPLTPRVVGAPQMILQPVFSIVPVLHCPLGLGELHACPFPDVVFPPLPVSALSSSPNLTQGKRAQFTATLSGENEPN